jgi:hypothetical protein
MHGVGVLIQTCVLGGVGFGSGHLCDNLGQGSQHAYGMRMYHSRVCTQRLTAPLYSSDES